MMQIPKVLDKVEKQKPLTLDFFLCSFSFSFLLVSGGLGYLAIIAFLLPWPLILAKRPQQAVQSLVSNWLLLLLPFLCIISAAWSNEPIWTIKASCELAVTMVVGIWAGSLVSPRIVISSLMTSLIFIAFLCVAFGIRDGMLGIGGEAALQGIFESKNAFSVVMCLLLLISFSVFSDKGQHLFFRALAYLSILFTPGLLFLGHSVGAMVAVFFTIILFRLGRFLARFGQSTRTLIYTLIFIVFLAAVIPLSIIQINPLSILDMVGKDSTLTGRTYLWEKAADLISQKPLQGVGYRAFWRIGNPPAEELWYYAHVPSGAGFNFHNEYIEMLVELGLLGFTLMMSYFIIITKRVAAALLQDMQIQQTFACLMFILFMLRTPLEVGIFDLFSISVVLFCLIWTYLRPIPSVKENSLIKLHSINPEHSTYPIRSLLK